MSDTWDAMRASTFDLYEDGKPSENLETLLGSLGAARQPYTAQVKALREWLDSAAARPAPQKLVDRARGFLSASE